MLYSRHFPFKLVYGMYDIDVMCLTETWLTANDESLMPTLIPAG